MPFTLSGLPRWSEKKIITTFYTRCYPCHKINIERIVTFIDRKKIRGRSEHLPDLAQIKNLYLYYNSFSYYSAPSVCANATVNPPTFLPCCKPTSTSER